MRFVCWTAIAIACACGDELFVNAHVGLDDDCEVRPDDEHAVERPVFDLALGGTTGSEVCDDPFVAQLWVENPNGERARVDEAEVRLTTLSRELLRFDTSEVALPNPFLVSAAGPLPADGSGVIEVEAVPRDYARALGDFVGESILVTMTLFGETADGSELESGHFTLPLSICDGCRTLCASDAQSEAAECSRPSLGPLRTFCVDPEC
jgi:hypothetical protein